MRALDLAEPAASRDGVHTALATEQTDVRYAVSGRTGGHALRRELACAPGLCQAQGLRPMFSHLEERLNRVRDLADLRGCA